MTTPAAYETVIGLEVHAQLLTRSKLFCADSTEFGLPPNTAVSVVSLGHPGTLPRLNKEAVNLAIRLGLATSCEIVRENYFARKNYFYPDLPKGYQISQHTTPICRSGNLTIEANGESKSIRINRIHMEEDAGKSIHDQDDEFTDLDYNRAGVPLVEIVSEPDLRSADEAAAYLTKLRNLVRHLGVCDGNMQEGSFRCDVNISVRKKGEEKLGTKVEIKNLNSVRFMKKAIAHETQALIQQLENGETILQQTKGFDEKTGTTYTIRIKEDEDDYRYFPEPDLPPFIVDDEWIDAVKADMPESEEASKQKLQQQYGLSEQTLNLLVSDTDLLTYFKELAAITTHHRAAANWLTGPLRQYYTENDLSIAETNISPSTIALLIEKIEKNEISYGVATQMILPALLKQPHMDVEAFITANNLGIKDESETDELIESALQKHADKIAAYQKGKKGLLSVFVGEVMKLSKGKADAKKVTEKITERLKA